MKFASPYNRPKTLFVPSGEKIVDELGLMLDDNGDTVVGVIGKTDIYKPIQDALHSTLLSDVIERYERGVMPEYDFQNYLGLDSLKSLSEDVQDFTDMPGTLAEFNQLAIDSSESFNALRPEYRQVFGNSVNQFLSAVSDGSFVSRLQEAFPDRFLSKAVSEPSKAVSDKGDK